MPEKITYEEALIEKTAAKAKEVAEILNEQSLWSGETPHPSPTHDGKEEEQKVIRPKAKNISEKNPVGGELIVKAPPLNEAEFEKLSAFRKDYDKLMDAVHHFSLMRGSSQEDDAIARLKKIYQENQDKYGG
jgi:hypothetical protein